MKTLKVEYQRVTGDELRGLEREALGLLQEYAPTHLEDPKLNDHARQLEIDPQHFPVWQKGPLPPGIQAFIRSLEFTGPGSITVARYRSQFILEHTDEVPTGVLTIAGRRVVTVRNPAGRNSTLELAPGDFYWHDDLIHGVPDPHSESITLIVRDRGANRKICLGT